MMTRNRRNKSRKLTALQVLAMKMQQTERDDLPSLMARCCELSEERIRELLVTNDPKLWELHQMDIAAHRMRLSDCLSSRRMMSDDRCIVCGAPANWRARAGGEEVE